MQLTLYTEEVISAAHFLKGYQGKCSQMHGHTWKICVWVKGDEKEKDVVGILWDFSNLKKVVYELDHKFLNDVIKQNPSVENISLFVYEMIKNDFPNLSFKVRIYESIIKKESYCETGDFE
ncbi:MAG: 6-carboxytetrahydropterin synthase [Spirochaetes bacterium]|nr:6-carboxytetrahydropterin synthase [Spirochaetota bacterium]